MAFSLLASLGKALLGPLLQAAGEGDDQTIEDMLEKAGDTHDPILRNMLFPQEAKSDVSPNTPFPAVIRKVNLSTTIKPITQIGDQPGNITHCGVASMPFIGLGSDIVFAVTNASDEQLFAPADGTEEIPHIKLNELFHGAQDHADIVPIYKLNYSEDLTMRYSRFVTLGHTTQMTSAGSSANQTTMSGFFDGRAYNDLRDLPTDTDFTPTITDSFVTSPADIISGIPFEGTIAMYNGPEVNDGNIFTPYTHGHQGGDLVVHISRVFDRFTDFSNLAPSVAKGQLPRYQWGSNISVEISCNVTVGARYIVDDNRAMVVIMSNRAVNNRMYLEYRTVIKNFDPDRIVNNSGVVKFEIQLEAHEELIGILPFEGVGNSGSDERGELDITIRYHGFYSRPCSGFPKLIFVSGTGENRDIHISGTSAYYCQPSGNTLTTTNPIRFMGPRMEQRVMALSALFDDPSVKAGRLMASTSSSRDKLRRSSRNIVSGRQLAMAEARAIGENSLAESISSGDTRGIMRAAPMFSAPMFSQPMSSSKARKRRRVPNVYMATADSDDEAKGMRQTKMMAAPFKPRRGWPVQRRSNPYNTRRGTKAEMKARYPGRCNNFVCSTGRLSVYHGEQIEDLRNEIYAPDKEQLLAVEKKLGRTPKYLVIVKTRAFETILSYGSETNPLDPAAEIREKDAVVSETTGEDETLDSTDGFDPAKFEKVANSLAKAIPIAIDIVKKLALVFGQCTGSGSLMAAGMSTDEESSDESDDALEAAPFKKGGLLHRGIKAGIEAVKDKNNPIGKAARNIAKKGLGFIFDKLFAAPFDHPDPSTFDLKNKRYNSVELNAMTEREAQSNLPATSAEDIQLRFAGIRSIGGRNKYPLVTPDGDVVIDEILVTETAVLNSNKSRPREYRTFVYYANNDQGVRTKRVNWIDSSLVREQTMATQVVNVIALSNINGAYISSLLSPQNAEGPSVGLAMLFSCLGVTTERLLSGEITTNEAGEVTIRRVGKTGAKHLAAVESSLMLVTPLTSTLAKIRETEDADSATVYSILDYIGGVASPRSGTYVTNDVGCAFIMSLYGGFKPKTPKTAKDKELSKQAREQARILEQERAGYARKFENGEPIPMKFKLVGEGDKTYEVEYDLTDFANFWTQQRLDRVKWTNEMVTERLQKGAVDKLKGIARSVAALKRKSDLERDPATQGPTLDKDVEAKVLRLRELLGDSAHKPSITVRPPKTKGKGGKKRKAVPVDEPEEEASPKPKTTKRKGKEKEKSAKKTVKTSEMDADETL